MQAAQDITIGARLNKTQFQYTLNDADPGELNHWAALFLDKFKAVPGITDVATDQLNAGPLLDITIKREVASSYGILPYTIDNTLDDAFGQRIVSTMYTTLQQYHVILEVESQVPVWTRSAQRHLRQIVERAAGAVVHAGRLGGEGRAARDQPHRPVPVGDDLVQSRAGHRDRPGRKRHPRRSKRAASAALAADQLPGQRPGIRSVACRARRSSSSPSLFVIYLILGVLYESVIHPITIISTLPSAGVGALLLLMAVHYDLSVIAIVGIILLIGIVKKNGIMLVDFAQQVEQNEGLTAEESIYQACIMRFRPILMTTMAALLGAVPMMVGTGVGSEIRQPLGYAIVGGLALSQILTLYTTPVVYIYLDRLQTWLFGERSQRPGTQADARRIERPLPMSHDLRSIARPASTMTFTSSTWKTLLQVPSPKG